MNYWRSRGKQHPPLTANERFNAMHGIKTIPGAGFGSLAGINVDERYSEEESLESVLAERHGYDDDT